MRQRENSGHPLGAWVLRRQLNAVVSNASYGTRAIRRRPRVVVVSVTCRGEGCHPFVHHLSRGTRAISHVRLVNHVAGRLIFVNHGVIRSRAAGVTRNFHRDHASCVVEHSNLRLRERFIRDHLFGERKDGRLPSSLMQERLIRPFFLTVRSASANEAMGLVAKRRVRLNVRVLRVRFRVKGNLHSISRCQGLIVVNFFSGLLCQVSHARRVQRVYGQSGFYPFQGGAARHIRTRLTFFVRQGRFRHSPFANDLCLPKGSVKVIFRRQGSRFIANQRAFINGTKDGRISHLYHPAHRGGLIKETNIRRLLRNLTYVLVHFHHHLTRRVGTTIGVNVRVVVTALSLFRRAT